MLRKSYLDAVLPLLVGGLLGLTGCGARDAAPRASSTSTAERSAANSPPVEAVEPTDSGAGPVADAPPQRPDTDAFVARPPSRFVPPTDLQPPPSIPELPGNDTPRNESVPDEPARTTEPAAPNEPTVPTETGVPTESVTATEPGVPDDSGAPGMPAEPGESPGQTEPGLAESTAPGAETPTAEPSAGGSSGSNLLRARVSAGQRMTRNPLRGGGGAFESAGPIGPSAPQSTAIRPTAPRAPAPQPNVVRPSSPRPTSPTPTTPPSNDSQSDTRSDTQFVARQPAPTPPPAAAPSPPPPPPTRRPAASAPPSRFTPPTPPPDEGDAAQANEDTGASGGESGRVEGNRFDSGRNESGAKKTNALRDSVPQPLRDPPPAPSRGAARGSASGQAAGSLGDAAPTAPPSPSSDAFQLPLRAATGGPPRTEGVPEPPRANPIPDVPDTTSSALPFPVRSTRPNAAAPTADAPPADEAPQADDSTALREGFSLREVRVPDGTSKVPADELKPRTAALPKRPARKIGDTVSDDAEGGRGATARMTDDESGAEKSAEPAGEGAAAESPAESPAESVADENPSRMEEENEGAMVAGPTGSGGAMVGAPAGDGQGGSGPGDGERVGESGGANEPGGANESVESVESADDGGVATPLALLKAEDETPYKIVKVFFATDRRPVDPALLASRQRRLWPLVGSLALVVFGVVTAVFYSEWRRWSLGFVIAGGAAALVIVVGQRGALPVAVSTVDASGSGTVAYGNERGDLQLGECEITIPKSHREGRVERPSVWRLELKERADKHVILRRVERQPSDKFFTGVRNRVNQSPRKDLFVFIHGYNVSFDTAARRTAQMAHDLDFEGAPIFFSWPSQGGMLQYTVDENNVAWAVPHLKQFLRDLIKQSGAEGINVIAHSMGNRALASAIREMSLESQANQQHFDQIVLAAPDVDAEVFRRDIAPALVKSAKHVTLYASSRDHALQASKVVHGYPRAGDSGDELVVVPGIDTIDVTDADMSILGHSYYGSSQPIVNDLESLLRRDLPAERRQWLERAERDGQVYWIFDEPAATANWKQRFMQ